MATSYFNDSGSNELCRNGYQVKPEIVLNLLIDSCIEMGYVERAVTFVEDIISG